MAVSTILEVVYGGWTLIWYSVKLQFKDCEDMQFLVLMNLLDNYCPLVLSFYSITLQMNNFESYLNSMLYAWMMFVRFKRRHYNKSLLSFFENYLNWKENYPELAKTLEDNIAAFVDEYPR